MIFVALIIIGGNGGESRCEGYGETINEKEKVEKDNEIRHLVNQIKKMHPTKDDFAYFPELKTRLSCESDSSFYSKIAWLLNVNLININSYDKLEQIINDLSGVKLFLEYINIFEKFLYEDPPKVYLEEFIQCNVAVENKRNSIRAEINVDTIKLRIFSDYDFLLRYAKGASKYNIFIEQTRKDGFLDILADIVRIKDNGADTIAIIKTVLEKIIKADERVRMLAFGYYYGVSVSQDVWLYVNLHLNRIYEYKSIQTNIDSEYVEIFTSDLFKKFGKIYKDYSRKIDSMKIDVKYKDLYVPTVFDEAPKIKEYLQSVSKDMKLEKKK